MKNFTKLCLIAAIATTVTMPVQAKKFKSVSELIVFGDSNVDMGYADPEGDSLSDMTYGVLLPAPHVDGRASNGPILIEYVANTLNVPISNYSVAGATTGEVNLIRYLAPGQFPGVDVTGVANQIVSFEEDLGGKKANKKAIYVYWAGSNDLYGASAETAPGASDAAIANIEAALTKLVDLGAKKILVATRTPRQDFYGTDNVNGMVFNSDLRVKIQALDKSLKANIQVFDAFDYTSEMKHNPEKYGFTNTTDFCFEDPICSVDLGVAQGYMLWDAPHKTTRVHELLAEKMVDQIKQMRRKRKCSRKNK